MLRRLARASALALALAAAAAPGARALGEGTDPRAVEAANLAINALHAELAARTGEVALLERLVTAYNDRIHLLDGADPEGLLAVDRLSDELLARDPENVMALLNLADALHSKGKIDEAFARAKRAAERAPDDGRVNLLLSRLSFLHTDFAAAVRSAVLAAASAEPRIAEAGATELVLARKFSDEWQALEADCAARPNATAPRLAKARFLLRKELAERPENARRAFAEIDELVKKNPEFAEGLIFLSEVALQHFEDPQRAERFARQAMKVAADADVSRLASRALSQATMKRMTAPKRGRGR